MQGQYASFKAEDPAMKRSDKKGAASPSPLQVQAPQVWPLLPPLSCSGCAAPQAALFWRRCAASGSGCAPVCLPLWGMLLAGCP